MAVNVPYHSLMTCQCNARYVCRVQRHRLKDACSRCINEDGSLKSQRIKRLHVLSLDALQVDYTSDPEFHLKTVYLPVLHPWAR